MDRQMATDERLAKAGEVEIIDATPTEPLKRQRILDAPLDRLWKAGTITHREFEAGDRYRNDAYLAAIDPSAGAVDLNRTGGAFGSRVPAMFTSQTLADARIRWRRINERIPERSLIHTMLEFALIYERNFEEIGEVFGLGVAESPHLRGHEAARAAARAGLRVALAALADHYELQGRKPSR